MAAIKSIVLSGAAPGVLDVVEVLVVLVLDEVPEVLPVCVVDGLVTVAGLITGVTPCGIMQPGYS
jgi:hypothetical protein